MEKQTKTILIISIILLVLVIAYAVYNYTSLPEIVASKANNLDSVIKTGSVLKPYDNTLDLDKTLFLNDNGETVKTMQQAINTLIVSYGYTIPTLKEDGVYGQKTEDAIKSISNGKLMSGNVTYNKIINLPKYPTTQLFAPNPVSTYPFLN